MNRRLLDFQSSALPTELPIRAGRNRRGGYGRRQETWLAGGCSAKEFDRLSYVSLDLVGEFRGVCEAALVPELAEKLDLEGLAVEITAAFEKVHFDEVAALFGMKGRATANVGHGWEQALVAAEDSGANGVDAAGRAGRVMKV